MTERNNGHGLKTKKLLDAARASGSALSQALRKTASAGAAERSMAGMNVVMFITDQDRAIQHFPPGWAERNLPGATRLARHGVSFKNAFTNSCMCSPARSTLMTGFFPAQTGVKYTLETGMYDRDTYDQVELPLELPNLATVLRAAGYEVVYKGKWHLSKPPHGGTEWEPRDVEKYGFWRWNPPDAGANQTVPEAGGGEPDNDGRFMTSKAGPDSYEGVLEYLHSAAARQQPFFLVVSLVNPHDVLFYPTENFTVAGYDDSWLLGDIEPPETVNEDLTTKPVVQREFLALFNLMGAVSQEQQPAYLNFYGNLMKASDQYLVDVLHALDETGLRDNTVVIRTADHGEMGLAHGGLRQKNFNFYEESLRVPLIFSSPALYDGPYESDALVSHVDFLPTLATLFGAPESARAAWQGVDYSAVVLDPQHAPAPQDYVVFTWDDWQAGQPNGPYLPPPNHIVSIREERYKLAQYYDAVGDVPSQWEMYDLLHDPLERWNIAWRDHPRTDDQEREMRRLKDRLDEVRRTRLQPLPTTDTRSVEAPRRGQWLSTSGSATT